MCSIGELSRHTRVTVPTIRYDEEMGLLSARQRTEGNRRCYALARLQRLSFIKHARDFGLPIEAISSLVELQNHPDRSCQAAGEIAEAQLADVRAKTRRLRSLERELLCISGGCTGDGVSEDCYVLASLAGHTFCGEEHRAEGSAVRSTG